MCFVKYTLPDQLQNVSMGGLLANILLVPEYVGAPLLLGVTWTLPIEFAWYGLCALIFALGANRWAFAAALAYSLAVIILALASVWLGIRVPMGRVCLVNAALLGYVHYLWFIGVANARQLNVATLCFAGSSTVALEIAFGYFTHPTTGASGALLAWGAALAVFAGVIAFPAVRGSRLLTGKLAIACGGISYSIYISHPIFVDLLLPANNIVVLAMGASLLTLICSVFMYKWVEQPGIAVGRALVGRLRRSNIAVLGGPRSGRGHEDHPEAARGAAAMLRGQDAAAGDRPQNRSGGEQ